MGKLAGHAGYGLSIDEDGSLELRIGCSNRVETVSTGVALSAGHWYFIAASYDAASGELTMRGDADDAFVAGLPMARVSSERCAARDDCRWRGATLEIAGAASRCN